MVELIVPPVYLLCFSMAYFGPNASFIGNIKNSYWQYIGVEDVDYSIKIVCLFFSIDLVSGIGCYLMLWCTCRINLFRAHIALQKEFGDIFLVTLIFILNTVSIEQLVLRFLLILKSLCNILNCIREIFHLRSFQ